MVEKANGSATPGVTRSDKPIRCVLIKAPITVTLERSRPGHILDTLRVAIQEKRSVVMRLKNADLDKRPFDLTAVELVQER